MQGAQRVFEDRLVKEQQENEELKKEMKGLHEKNRKQHEVRNTLLALASVGLSDELLVRCAWSSWRECVKGSKDASHKLQELLKERAPHLVADLKGAIEEDIHPLEAWIHKQGRL